MAQQPIVYDAAQDLVDQLVGLKSDDATCRRAPSARQGRRRHPGQLRRAVRPGPARDAGRAPAGRAVCRAPDARARAGRTTASAQPTPAPAPPTSNWPSPASRRTPPTRAAAILEFTRKLIEARRGRRGRAQDPARRRRVHAAVVTLSQLVAFLSYQVRLVAGLAMQAQASRPGRAAATPPAPSGQHRRHRARRRHQAARLHQ